MSAFPAAGHISNATISEGGVKQDLEDLLSTTKQIPGAAVAEAALTIAGGSITPATGAGVVSLDTEAGAATDDLTNVITTNFPDGSMVLLRNTNAARFVVVKQLAGGAGQMNLDRAADYTLDDTKKWLMLVRRGSDWYEVLRGPQRAATPVLAKSATYTVVKEDLGKTIACTGTFTLNLLAAAAAGNGFVWSVKNVGTGNITLDPNSAELIDAQATLVLGPGQGGLVACDGTAWLTQGVRVLPPGVGPFPFSGASAPYGFLLFGSNYSRTTYANLFAVVGTRYGAGDGSTTFGLHMEGRGVIAAGTGTVVDAGGNAEVDTTGDTLTVPANETRWITGMAVVFTLASGTITPLGNGTTYYVIRTSSTLIQLASSLANAQNGTAINLTAKSSPVWTVTHTLTARTVGDMGGEEAHAESSTEQLDHTHGDGGNASDAGNGGGQRFSGSNSNNVTSSTGGNAAMNVMNPFVVTNMIISY